MIKRRIFVRRFTQMNADEENYKKKKKMGIICWQGGKGGIIMRGGCGI